MLDLANKKCFEWAGSRAFCSQSSMCRGLLILDAPLPWLLAWLGQLHNTGGGRDQGNFHPFPLLQASSLIAGLSRSSFTKQTGHVLAACRQPQFLGSRNPPPLYLQPMWRSFFRCFTISHGLLPSSISCVTKYLHISMLRSFFSLAWSLTDTDPDPRDLGHV